MQVVDLSSDSEEEPEDENFIENDDDDGYAVILDDSSDEDEDEDDEYEDEDEEGDGQNSDTELASQLIRHIQLGSPQREPPARVQPRDDEPLFVSSDDDDLVLVEVRPVPAVRPRLGGSGVKFLKNAYFAQSRSASAFVKQERS